MKGVKLVNFCVYDTFIIKSRFILNAYHKTMPTLFILVLADKWHVARQKKVSETRFVFALSIFFCKMWIKPQVHKGGVALWSIVEQNEYFDLVKLKFGGAMISNPCRIILKTYSIILSGLY